jgi:hypothetical protein
MSESSTSPGAGETAMDHNDGAAVILLSVWWKNPFLWMALGMGIPGTIMMAGGGERLQSATLVVAALTVVGAGVALLALNARLEIRPDAFREEIGFGRTVEYRWADVGSFAVLKESESEDAVSFLVLKKGRATGETGRLAGAYGESVEALTDRMNAAREKALGPEATAYANRPRVGMRRP